MRIIRLFGFLCLAVAAATAGHGQSATATGGSAHQQMYSNISRQMSTLRNVVESGFASVREDIKSVNDRLATVEDRLDTLEGSMNIMNSRLVAVESAVKKIGTCGANGQLWNGSQCAKIDGGGGTGKNCGKSIHGTQRSKACTWDDVNCRTYPAGSQRTLCEHYKSRGLNYVSGNREEQCQDGNWVELSSNCGYAPPPPPEEPKCQPGYKLCDGICSQTCGGAQ